MSPDAPWDVPSTTAAREREPLFGHHHRRLIAAGLSAGWVREETDVMFRGAASDEIEDELRQVHLPMLAAAGVIEWNRETGQISRGPNFESAERALRSWEDGEADAGPR